VEKKPHDHSPDEAVVMDGLRPRATVGGDFLMDGDVTFACRFGEPAAK